MPWKEPSFTAQVLAMILFAFGGAGGVINASYNINLVIHNTAWVPGHFHLTVGTAVTLTFMGILYWMLPYITGKQLWSKTAALWQAWSWFIGMAIFSTGLHRIGRWARRAARCWASPLITTVQASGASRR